MSSTYEFRQGTCTKCSIQSSNFVQNCQCGDEFMNWGKLKKVKYSRKRLQMKAIKDIRKIQIETNQIQKIVINKILNQLNLAAR